MTKAQAARQNIESDGLHTVANGRMVAKDTATFDQVLRSLPGYLIGNYDPYLTNTFDDLFYMVQHEIDLYQEGEESDIKTKKQCINANRWLLKLKALSTL